MTAQTASKPPPSDTSDHLQLAAMVFDARTLLYPALFYHSQSILSALFAGARGEVLEDVEAEEMQRSIRSVSNAEAIFSPAIAIRLINVFAARRPSAPKERFPTLDQRESVRSSRGFERLRVPWSFLHTS